MLSASEISPQDAQLLATKHSAIADAARIYGFNLSEGAWAIAQAACPEAPRHLIAQFRDAEAGRANSIFTVVVPRQAGAVRIIPILRRGMPNGWNFGQDVQQREFVNRIIEPHPVGDSDINGDWTSLASCYAALVGDRLASRRSLIAHVAPHGLSELDFSAVGIDNALHNWRIRFNQHREMILFDSASRQETMRPVQDAPPFKQQALPAGSAPVFAPVPPVGVTPKPLPPLIQPGR